MGQETIDIVVKESGSDKAARDVLAIGTAADTTDTKLTALNANITALAGAVQKNTDAVTAASAAADKQATEEEKAAKAVRDHAAAMESGAAAAEQLRGILVSLGLALGVSEWVKLTDAYQQNVNQLKQVATSTEEFAALQERLHQISEETFSDLGTNTKLFVSMTKASRDLQISHSDLLNVVHVLNDSLRLSGASTEEAQAALQALSVALQRGSISARQILPLLHEMPDLMAALADKFGYTGNRTAEFVNALTKGEVPVRAILMGIAQLDNTLVSGARHIGEHTSELNKNFQSVQILRAGTDSFSASMTSARSRIMTVSQSVTDLTHDMDASGKTITATGNAANALSTKFQQVTPTITNAWKNVQTALEGYVGAQDRMTGGSSKVAEALQFIATNAHTVFGALQVIAAALATYTLAVNASRIATLLFASSFSPFAAIVTVIAVAAAAMVAFGNDVKVSADGSITALGALYGVVSTLKEALVFLWTAVGSGVGAWGQILIAVTLFTVAVRLLLGIDLIGWIASAVTGLGSLAVATYAAIGPWGLLATAILGAALALAYYTGALDPAIAAVKEKLAPALDYLSDKMKSATADLNATSIATKDFGRAGEDTAATIAQSFGNIGSVVGSNLGQVNTALKSSEAGFQDWAGEVSSDMSSVVSKAQSTASALANLKGSSSGSGRSGSQFISNYTGDFFADNPTAGHHGGVVFNNSGILSSNDLHNPGFAGGGSFTVGGQGGTDSQLVKFMASPDERVTIETPSQQRARQSGSSPTVVQVSMTVNAKDATSFDQNRQQLVMGLQSELTRAVRKIGNA